MMVQKQAEREQLKSYLAACDIEIADDHIEPTERPDFILKIGSRDIGVEVTEYHVSGRRQVEEAWNRLRHLAFERKDYPLNRWVKLYFQEMRVPPTRDLDGFINEVIRFSDLHPEIEQAAPDADIYPILARYIDSISVSSTKAHRIMWFWNYDVAWVGPLESELISILAQKAKSAVASTSDYWLIIAGGNRLSTLLGLMDANQLRIMPNLESALLGSPFERVALLQQPVIDWRRGEGWSNRQTVP
ncbi:hypothetical protein ACFQ3K_16780 [Brucella gallinifaecis]|uniref:Uncharacterized protein n=2 Tax=Brucella gallinifaecis TaxID=215590 RepID=A0A502BLA9_9HYPH|nr:hypothetical protein FHY56_17665 [Brucella gallinifaecis]